MQVFDPMTTGSALMIQVDSPIQVSFPISNFQGQSILTSCFMSVPVPIRAPNPRSTSTRSRLGHHHCMVRGETSSHSMCTGHGTPLGRPSPVKSRSEKRAPGDGRRSDSRC